MTPKYDPEALRAEIPRLEEQIKMFEDKAKELRGTISQYEVWIEQAEKEGGQDESA